jgi:hypothetical protein
VPVKGAVVKEDEKVSTFFEHEKRNTRSENDIFKSQLLLRELKQ